MAEAYPYILSNNKLDSIFTRIRSAARPEKFTASETLVSWGFTASNDRAAVRVLKDLGFLNESGGPTEHYDRLRDPNDWKFVLAERMRELYRDLFAIDSNMQSAPDTEIKGAISRVTGKDDETVRRYFLTFKTLAGLAKFDAKPTKEGQQDVRQSKLEATKGSAADAASSLGGGAAGLPTSSSAQFHYNIQIHLPATTDIAVYNAIFRSLKEHLRV